ncbi:diacylglycerol kinase family protein [Thalassotalea sp. SU-HH00458]|uniref:diacylglycerol kinase family protein n=1 Tax=Thalassotalea sp. SU-HH00458 TaxID=3127657 RepID=UPI003365425B
MFIVKYYVTAALLCFLMAFYLTFVLFQALLIWLGLSLLLVSIAYTFQMPSIFRKSQDGKISAWIQWAFIPFLTGAKIYNAWARRHDKAPAIQKVQDNLYLSRRLFSEDLHTLNEQGISCIVDVTAEFVGLESAMTDKKFDYLNIPTLDHQVPSLKQLFHALNWIDVQISQSNAVVVHCALGRGRSVFVVAAYILSKDTSLSVEQVLTSLNQIRSTANLNRAQLKILHAIQNNKQLQLQSPTWLIINPVSGGGKWQTYQQQLLRELTKTMRLRVYETTPSLSAKDLTEDAIKQGVSTVIVGGGDGTVTEVAGALIHRDITLGIIPLGTANALCHVLYGINSKVSPIESACHAITSDNIQKIDTAQCNGQPILLLLGIGFEQKMIAHAHREEKNEQGQLAYLTGFFNAVMSEEHQEIRVTFDDETTENIKAHSLVIANIAPFSTVLAHGGKPPKVNDGQLHVTYLDNSESLGGRLLALSDLTLSSLGLQDKSTLFQYKDAQHIVIQAKETIDYVIDGENFSAEELSISIKPESLKVFSG